MTTGQRVVAVSAAMVVVFLLSDGVVWLVLSHNWVALVLCVLVFVESVALVGAFARDQRNGSNDDEQR